VDGAVGGARIGGGGETSSSGRYLPAEQSEVTFLGSPSTTSCSAGTVSRDQMAKFLVNAFQLVLYGA